MVKEKPEKKKSAAERIAGGAIKGGVAARWSNRKASPEERKKATRKGAAEGGVGAIQNPVARKVVKGIFKKK